MIYAMPFKKTPEWLMDIASGKEDSGFPLLNVLQNSLYYPACGLNGTPVKFLGGNIHSFIYADYGVKKIDFMNNLNGATNRCGFKGYHSIKQMELKFNDLAPSGWSPMIVPTQHLRLIQQRQQVGEPFGHWSIWKRKADFPPEHGPEYFSFLYLGGEMSAVYQALYTRNNLKPKVLAIIQPGAFGGEWECVTSDNSFFKRVVKANPAGVPDYLLCGGFGTGYQKPCWNDYLGNRLIQLPERSAGLWKQSSNRSELFSDHGTERRKQDTSDVEQANMRIALCKIEELIPLFADLKNEEIGFLSRYLRSISREMRFPSDQVHGQNWNRLNLTELWNQFGSDSYREFAFDLLSWAHYHDDPGAVQFISRYICRFLPETEEIEQILLRGVWDKEKSNGLRACFFKCLSYQFNHAAVDFFSVKLERFIRENGSNEKLMGAVINSIHRNMGSDCTSEKCKELVLAYMNAYPTVKKSLCSPTTKRMLDIL